MAGKMRLEIHKDGVKAMRTDDAVQEFVNDLADGIVQTAGDGFERVNFPQEKNRARASVKTSTIEAALRVHADPTVLTGAVGGTVKYRGS